MDIYGKTKGTELEKMVEQMAIGEAKGAMMYYSLARIAKSYGLDDVEKQFIEIGNQEANHAGFYATLNGKYPSNEEAFWKLVKGLSKAEEKGDASLLKFAQKFQEMGLGDVAETVKEFAEQEKQHGIITQNLVEKYSAKKEDNNNKPVYVCSVCGYEHEGDIADEPDDYKCPLCGMGKEVFQLKQ